MKCPNCNNTLTCGCQRRVATNGAQVCTSCLTSYEMKLNKDKATKAAIAPITRTDQNTAPIVVGVNVQL